MKIGPYRERPTYDAIAQAMSGLWSQLTDIHDPEPVGPPISDQLTGLYAAYGILAALVHRQRTGTGRRLEVSMLGASIAFQPHAAAEYLMSNRIAGKTTRARVSQSYSFVGSDGLPFAVHMSSPPKFWTALLKVVDRPELAQDSRFATKPDRETHYDELRAELQAIFISRSLTRRSSMRWGSGAARRWNTWTRTCATEYSTGPAQKSLRNSTQHSHLSKRCAVPMGQA